MNMTYLIRYGDIDVEVTAAARHPLKCCGLASVIISDVGADILMDSGLVLNDPLHPHTPYDAEAP
jgi:hypothetical protein